jgi:hypothetical protein
MRILRLAAISLLVLAVLLCGAAVALIANQDKIMRRVIDGVQQRTGYDITVSATHIHFSSHLILEFDNPHVSKDQHELAKVKSLRALVSYHRLIFSQGMPLFSLVLVQPELRLPAKAGFATSTPLPRVGTELVDTIVRLLNGLERASWRIQTTDATVRDANGAVLFDRLGLIAFRRHRQPDIWRASFSVRVVQEPFDDLLATGRIRVAAKGAAPNHQIASLAVWFWNDHVNRFSFSTARIAGRISGSGKFTLADDGSGSGSVSIGIVGLMLSAKDSDVTERLGDYSLQANFSEAPDAMKLKQLRVLRAQTMLASGDAALTGLSGSKQVVTVHLRAGVPLEVGTVRSHLRYFHNVPDSVRDALSRTPTGQVLFSNVTLATTPEKLMNHTDAAIRDGIDLSASLSNLSFSLPEDLKLPMVSQVRAQLRYAHNTMSATQGSAIIDQSSLSDVKARVDFAKKFDAIEYLLSFNCDANLGQLRPAIMNALERFKVEARKQIVSLSGRLSIQASTSGAFRLAAPVPPRTYRVRVEANHAVLSAKGAPAPISFVSGAVTLQPGVLRFNRLALTSSGGDGTVDGTLALENSRVRMRDMTVELHEMPAGPWLALAVDPDSLSVQGAVGGKVRIHTDPARAGGLLANGKLVINRGSVQFGFLRAPMKIQGASISLDGRSLSVAMPSSTLEGSPIDFRMSVADLGDPTLRIDANVERLDFEVMKFIRLPWTPATPPVVFPIPVKGHIEAHHGNLSKLKMTSIKTDFWRINGDWKVYNFTARAFNGTADLEISGRAKDDWIQIHGKAANMDIGSMFLMSGTRKESPIVGKIWIAANLSADTNNDFFETLEGETSVTVRDGMLNRFTLLSRMLAMIDLKSWLTAQFPDPTVSGLPFQTILMDLKGERGVFTTEDFRLQGPIMAITAEGDINFVDSSMDMKLAAFPLSTLNWVLSKIPVIGNNMAGSAGSVVAAYFHAHGPVSDPSVTPMPITSGWEMLIKTLGLPINVIRPNTIK